MSRFNNISEVEKAFQGKKKIRYIGELKVAEMFFKEFDQQIKCIEYNPGKGIDLKIHFKDHSSILTVEVKSSNFKNDYISDMWLYGVPIKKKDFESGFDLLAMVNFLPDPKKEEKLNTKSECVILFFTFNDLDKLYPNPYMILPKTNLDRFHDKEIGFIDKINNFYNNFYKSINIEGDLIFKIYNLPNDQIYRDNLKFPEWFGKDEICIYIRKYHESIKLFYEEHIKKEWKKRIDVKKMVEEALSKKIKKDFEEKYFIEKDYCKNCTGKCEYIIINKNQ